MYDVIIIGKGPAGLSASLYTARGGLKTLVIGKESVLTKGKKIENYCCSEPMSGEELIQRGIEQAKSFNVEIVEEEVVDIRKDNSFTVQTRDNTYEGKAIIIATGKVRKSIPIEGLKKFEGKGVHYCVTCDGFFYSGMKVGILGFKDYAVHELKEMAGITEDLTLYTNGNSLDADGENRKYIEEKGIRVCEKAIKALEGSRVLERLVFESGEREEINGLFVAYGSASSVDFARKLGILLDRDNIIVDKDQKTNVEGVFAAGDCTGGLTQVATAVGQGAIAGQKAKAYVMSISK